jgi:signal peptidase I
LKTWKKLPFNNGINVGDVVISTSPLNAKIGDVLVINAKELSYPLVHRVIGLDCNGTIIKNLTVYIKDYPNCKLITKGDNNLVKDPFVLYYKDVAGKVSFVIPALGLPRIIVYKILHI